MIPEPLKNFIDLFAKLPGIGPRQASRIAFWLVKQPRERLEAYQRSLADITNRIGICSQCSFVFAQEGDETLCHICRDTTRDRSIIAVVEKETDLVTIEKTKKFKGLYHVLGGTVSSLAEANKSLTMPALLERVKKSTTPIKEILLALSHTTEGDLTAMELEKVLAPVGVTITRLGRGLPRGAEIEFADEDTITSALEGRK